MCVCVPNVCVCVGVCRSNWFSVPFVTRIHRIYIELDEDNVNTTNRRRKTRLALFRLAVLLYCTTHALSWFAVLLYWTTQRTACLANACTALLYDARLVLPCNCTHGLPCQRMYGSTVQEHASDPQTHVPSPL